MTIFPAANKPYSLFILGLVLTTIATLILYKIIPTYNLLGGQWLIYPQGETSPKTLVDEISYTNTKFLIRLGIYNSVYWLFFLLVYIGLQYFAKIRVQMRYIKVHFILSLLAFLFIICLNDKITFASTYFNTGASDIYISSDLPEIDMAQMSSDIQFMSSLTSSTSLIGMALLVSGIGIFFVGLIMEVKSFKP
ncbi:MAG: hypothetical protein EBR30_17845 [Cytophagia bacterium]|nr:hypothetical protein [Cytophagia bacterium]